MTTVKQLKQTNPTKTCPVCQREFSYLELRCTRRYTLGVRDWEKRIFCSKECRSTPEGTRIMRGGRKNLPPAQPKICPQCGKEFSKARTTSRAAWERQRFCSKQCFDTSRKGKQPEWLVDKCFQPGHVPKHKGRCSSYGTCRICGRRFPDGGNKDLVSCDNPECRAASKEIRKKNCGAAMRKLWAEGRVGLNSTWATVPTVTEEELILAPYLEKAGWIHQYKVCVYPKDKSLHSRTYHLDFALPSLKLYVEVDGSSHRKPERQERDKLRTTLLLEQGWCGMRFWNREVKKTPQAVYDKIADWVIKMRLDNSG